MFRRSALAAVASLCLAPLPAFADETGAGSLPLSKIVLFNSGVGFYQHDATITGDQKVELKFNVNDVNDLLKSMVLQDLGGGRIAPVTYGSKDPITKTLRTFAIDLTDNPTLFDLLSQVRGEPIEVETPNLVAGTLLGLERRKQKSGDDVVDVEFINLLTEQGIRSFPLSTLTRIKLRNEQLDAELRQALLVLAMGHSTDKKSVTLQFMGQGKRPVRVGYVQESPIWKTSYRLVVDGQGKPFLQGWAIVENTTEQDWKNVNLTLVSGRPISFVMNLYDPLYIPRPIVEPELFASLRPQTYGQDMNRLEAEFARRASGTDRQRELAAADALRKNGVPMAAAAPMAPGMAGKAQAGRGLADDKAFGAAELQQSVGSIAEAGKVGELFQYVIDTPVTLPRQQSAMLPIVNASIDGEKVSIYNAQVHAAHPLNGLRLKNTTGLHLMQGPITVFDGGAYAGDARIEDLQPNTERLVSYALDLDTEVAIEPGSRPDELVSVRIIKGTLLTTHKFQQTKTYTVKNSSAQTKTVLIEQPLQGGWTLIEPTTPNEKTRDRYRFAVSAEPGKPAKLVVREELVNNQSFAINNLDDGRIQFYLSAKVVGENIKQALLQVVEKKRAIEQLNQQLAQVVQQLKAIEEEQNRIRQNMQQLDRNSDLYRRYVTKFGQQEDDVEKLRQSMASLQTKIEQQRRDLDTFLINLTLS